MLGIGELPYFYSYGFLIRIKLIFYFKIKSNNRETLSIRLYSNYEKYKYLGKYFIIDRFISEGEIISEVVGQQKFFNKQAKKVVNRAKCATLYHKYRESEWILDDESYFTLTHSTINGNDNLYSDKIDFTPTKVQFRKNIITIRNFLSKSLYHSVGFQNPSSWQVGTQLISLSTETAV